MTKLIHALVVSNNGIEAAQLEALSVDCGALLRCHDDTPLARRVNGYLKTAQRQLVALRTLPDYAAMIDGTCTEVPPEAARYGWQRLSTDADAKTDGRHYRLYITIAVMSKASRRRI